MMATSPVRACIYCRISLARLGDTVKVDEQEMVCRRLAAQRGWVVADHHVFKDNSISAWRHNITRPAWEAMLDAIRANELDAIIVYHGDRLIRQPWDLEILLRLAQEGTLLAAPTGERDLSDPEDQFVLRIEAAVAKREVDNTSRRMRAKNDRLAEKGISRLGGRGGRAYGFEPDGLTVRQADAEVVREVAQRILTGEPVGAIARGLNDRGVTTTTGGPWDHGALKKLMRRPRLAGLLVHRGVVVGPAAWPAILDMETWEAVGTVLERKAAAFDYTTNARRYLLTGIARCGTCDQTLAVRHNTRAGLTGYGCINPECGKKVHRAVHHLDPYVEGYVIERLGDRDLRDRLQPATVDTSGLVTELEQVQRRRERTIVEFGDDDEMGADVLRLNVRRHDKRITELRAEIAAARRPSVLDGLWGIDLPGWRGLKLHRQRTAVTNLVRVTVLASGRRGPGFDPDSVRLDPL